MVKKKLTWLTNLLVRDKEEISWAHRHKGSSDDAIFNKSGS